MPIYVLEFIGYTLIAYAVVRMVLERRIYQLRIRRRLMNWGG